MAQGVELWNICDAGAGNWCQTMRVSVRCVSKIEGHHEELILCSCDACTLNIFYVSHHQFHWIDRGFT